MHFKTCKNVSIGLLIVCLSLAGCRKKTSEPIEENGGQPVIESRVIQQEPVRETPPVMTPSANIEPITSPPAIVTSQLAPQELKAVQIALQTSKGEIVVELNQKAAPVTVANFLRYVNAGFYDGTLFHRVIAGFMIQGGGFTSNMVEKKTHSAIINEASNGLKNERGTIAMARTPLPHSATSQFYINHKDNTLLDYGTCADGYGYTVFGKVIKGMEVVDAIAASPTTMRDGEKSFPVQSITISKAAVVGGGV